MSAGASVRFSVLKRLRYLLPEIDLWLGRTS
jgi:hypothetical protein